LLGRIFPANNPGPWLRGEGTYVSPGLPVVETICMYMFRGIKVVTSSGESPAETGKMVQGNKKKTYF
jgi:hypothetical protein